MLKEPKKSLSPRGREVVTLLILLASLAIIAPLVSSYIMRSEIDIANASPLVFALYLIAIAVCVLVVMEVLIVIYGHIVFLLYGKTSTRHKLVEMKNSWHPLLFAFFIPLYWLYGPRKLKAKTKVKEKDRV